MGGLAAALRRSRRGRLHWALPLVTLVAGCQGVRWTGYAYAPALAQSQQTGKLVFIYFRSWASVDSTHFEEKVLANGRVRRALADMYTVALEYGVNEELAARYGLAGPPATVIVDPQGEPLAITRGVVSTEQLLGAINYARERYARQPIADAPGTLEVVP